jgi:hypothetical protein
MEPMTDTSPLAGRRSRQSPTAVVGIRITATN